MAQPAAAPCDESRWESCFLPSWAWPCLLACSTVRVLAWITLPSARHPLETPMAIPSDPLPTCILPVVMAKLMRTTTGRLLTKTRRVFPKTSSVWFSPARSRKTAEPWVTTTFSRSPLSLGTSSPWWDADFRQHSSWLDHHSLRRAKRCYRQCEDHDSRRGGRSFVWRRASRSEWPAQPRWR